MSERSMLRLAIEGWSADRMAIPVLRLRRVSQRLGNLGDVEKRLLSEALRIKVLVYPDRAKVQGSIPAYATIEQTWEPDVRPRLLQHDKRI